MTSSIRKFAITCCLLSTLFFADDCLPYQAGTHTWIAWQALNLVANPDLQDQDYRSEIVKGSWEADLKFYDEGTWRYDDVSAPRDHFWDPDTNKTVFDGFYTAYAKAYEYWDLAKTAYSNGRKIEAYMFLGHIGHLLADMAVPAHVLNDPHLWPNTDSYEDHVEEDQNYLGWTSDDVGSVRSAVGLYDLFYNLAQRAQYFPSDDRLGNQENADASWFDGWPQDSANMRIDQFGYVCDWWGSSQCHIEHGNCDKIASQLLPRAIEYTASLYNLFYEQFHMPVVTGGVYGRLHVNSPTGPALASAIVYCGGKSTLTGSDGYFSLSGVSAGNQTLSFSKYGYESYNRSILVTANQNLDAGDRWLVQESSPPTVENPDLAIHGLTIGDSDDSSTHTLHLVPGEEFRIDVTIINRGETTATSEFKIYYMISDDDRIAQDDQIIGEDTVTENIGVGDTYEDTKLNRTAPTTPGTYFIGAWVDSPEDDYSGNDFSRGDDERGRIVVEVAPKLQVLNSYQYLGIREVETPFSGSFAIRNEGGGVLVGNIAESAEWLTIDTSTNFSLSHNQYKTFRYSGNFPSTPGSFNTSILVTSNGGTYQIEVSGLSKVFVKTLSVEPESGPPGTTVTIRGSNFQPGAKAALYGSSLPVLGSCMLGDAASIAVSGSYAYSVTNNSYYYINNGYNDTKTDFRLQVIDVSDPSSPHIVGVSSDLPGYGSDVVVSGGYAYVLTTDEDDYYSLQVIDVSNASSPHRVGFCPTPGFYQPQSFTVSGTYAYVLTKDDDYKDSLLVIDVTDPSSPHIVGLCETHCERGSVAVIGSYAYFVNSSSLKVIDVSTPSTPHIVGSYGTCSHWSDWSERFAVLGNYAYLTSGYGLSVIDVSDPNYPHHVSDYYMPDGASVKYVGAYGNYVYVVDHYGLKMLDISDPISPQIVSSCNLYEGIYDFVVIGNRGYALTGGTLKVIDVNLPPSPQIVGYCKWPDWSGGAGTVALSGDYAYAYLSSSDWSLKVVDIRAPSSPRIVGHCVMPSEPTSVALSGNYAYVITSFSGLQVVDVSDPLATKIIGSCATTSGADSVTVFGNYAYAVTNNYDSEQSRYNSHVEIIDVSDPLLPQIVGSYATLGRIDSIAVSGNYAYVNFTDHYFYDEDFWYWYFYIGLQVIDVSDPSLPSIVGSWGRPTDNDLYLLSGAVALSGSYAYVTDGTGLYAIDVSNPSTPQFVGSCSARNNISAIALSGNFVYMADGSYGIEVVDVSDPSVPYTVGYYAMSDGNVVSSIAVSEKYVYGVTFDRLFVIPRFLLLDNVSWSDTNTLTATIPMAQRPGTWDLHVANPDGDYNVLRGAFTVPAVDSDGDGLPDHIEDGCTSATDADSDDDGILDGVEDPNDIVADAGETDPCDPDSDGDGIQDGTERGYTLNNIGPDTDVGVFRPDLDPTTVTDPLKSDTDRDGLLDGEEDGNLNGCVDAGEKDPNQVELGVVLFVDDDYVDSSGKYFTDALELNGFGYFKWNVNHEGLSPDVADMENYSAVIWNVGFSMLTLEEQQTISEYLDQGGSIFISGMELLYDVAPFFLSEYLHISNFENDAGTAICLGVDGDPVTDSMSLLMSDGYPYEYSDIIVPDEDAVGIFLRDVPDGTYTALRYPSEGRDPYRLVFFAFPFEAISSTDPSPNNSVVLMKRIIKWLDRSCGSDVDQDGDVDGSDLAKFANGGTSISLEDLSWEYGRDDCR